ncbi:MAG: HAMP domain-containing histidine kinase [Clostridia bacterium]|nr:HAMP domain-containing histidine kinase [Clostridia bacterium]
MDHKRYLIAFAALALSLLLLLGGTFALLAARTNAGLYSLALSVSENDPAALTGFAGALIGAAPSSEAAERGRAVLEEGGCPPLAVDRFTEKLFSGVLRGLVLAAAAVVGAAALFLLAERRRRIRRDEELTERIGAALRGESVFRAKYEDERDLARLFSQIDRVNALRESSANELREYLENAAHEIKSPTSGILLNLDLMERGGVSEQRLGAVRGCALRIDSYVAGLLTLARLRAGKVRMSFEPADLGELAAQVALELEANGVAAEISGESAVINCDGVRIKEAIRNLIVNASRHQGSGEPVRVRLFATEDEAALSVIDSGPGMKDGALIERYAVGREDGSGYGIGLALAKEVVARHSGRLTVIRPAAGTEIRLTIPRFKLKTSI